MTRRILLADDSVTIQKVIELTFMDEDYEVTAVSNGDEAVRLLGELQPDGVIADVHMPGANGYEVCRRAKAARPGVPVLLLVGTFEPFDEAQSRAVGADAFLKKPFDSQELLQLVGSLLGTAPAAESKEPPAEPAPAPAAAVFPAPAGPKSPFEAFPAGPAIGAEAPGLAAAAEPLDDLEREPAWSSFELEPEPERAGSVPASGWEEAAAPAFTPVEEQLFDLEDTGGSLALDDSMLATDVPPLSEAEAEALPFDDSFGRLGGREERAVSEHEGAPAFVGGALVGGDVEAPDFSERDQAEVQSPSGVQAPVGVQAPAAAASGGGAGLSDADVDRIARRLVELLGERVVRDVAWEVVPDMAEVVIKDRLRELESQAD